MVLAGSWRVGMPQLLSLARDSGGTSARDTPLEVLKGVGELERKFCSGLLVHVRLRCGVAVPTA